MLKTGQIEIPAFAEMLVALGTAMLAWATIELGLENKKMRFDNERIRKEDRKYEAKMRVRKWARDSVALLTTVSPFKLVLTQVPIMNLRGSFARSKSETLEAITDATNIGGQVKVQADDAANKLEILADWILGSNLNPDKIDQAAIDALESFNKVLKIIV